ncbi:MAG: ATP-binding cassette domain-containing protein [Pseudomonadota bacterium]
MSDLRFGYGAAPVIAVDQFTLQRSGSCLVLGPSGCGKTSFVQLLAGLLAPQEGTIEVLGTDLSSLSEAARDRFRGSNIGFVFQRLHLMPALSVRENLVLAQRLARSPRDSERIDGLLEQLGIADLRERKPSSLSQGQAQRAALARALVHRPALLIADEPTSALDDGHTDTVLELLLQAASDSGTALLIVTHDERLRGRLDSEFLMDARP